MTSTTFISQSPRAISVSITARGEDYAQKAKQAARNQQEKKDR